MSENASSAKLPYKIVKCSSYDDGYDHTQLETSHPSPHTKGWQSARFCDFPQTLILDFRKVVAIRKIQILSHQSKIASKIELQVGTCRKNSNDPNSAEWTRLGYMSLDSNERSNYKARELKSVYVHTRGRWLKLVIKKCHINTINLFNQVGIVCVNVVGPTSKAEDAPEDDLATGMSVDETTQVQIAELHRRKAQAIKREDYDEAKRLKYAIGSLKQIGAKVADLERLKRIAVSNEEYDRANELKATIARIRRDGLAGLAAQGLVKIQGQASRDDKSNRQRGLAEDERPLGGRRMEQDNVKQNNRQRDRDRRDERRDDRRDSHRDPAPPDVNDYPDNGPDRRDDYDNYNDKPIQPMRPDPADRPLNNKGNNQFLDEYEQDGGGHSNAGPEALSAAQRAEAEPMLAIFGQHNVQCLFAKTWSLRQQALQAIVSEAKKGGYDRKGSPTAVFEAMCMAIARGMKDKVAQVFQAACDATKVTVKYYCPKEVSKSASSPALEPVVRLLLEKMGEGNARLQKLGFDTMMFLAKYDGVSTAMVTTEILRPISKRNAGKPGPIKGRAELLVQLVPMLGLGSDSGLSGAGVMTWTLQYMEHPNGQIRELCVKITTEVYIQIGDARMAPFLEKVRPAIVETLQASFDAAGGSKVQESKSLNSTVDSDKVSTIQQHALNHTGQFAHDDSMNQFEDANEQYCQFCGEEDPSFTDEKLDLHYWQDCPMLTSCKQCEQVIEIPTLDEHLLDECEVTGKVERCKVCAAPVLIANMDSHQQSANCKPLGKNRNRCPMCTREIGKGEEGWKIHLLDEGCPNNPRGGGKR